MALAGKRVLTFDPVRFPHLDHGYAVTSYSAQGKTMDRVLVNAETTETDLLLNQRMAYVAVSRAKFDARVYTDSAADLGGALNRPKNKEMAIDALEESQAAVSNERSNELPIAAECKDAPAFEKPESLTHARPHGLGQTEKDSFSIARLRARAIVTESNIAVAQKQAEDFEKSRHFVSLEIDGEQWSLVSVDQDQQGKERAIELSQRAVSAYRKRLYGVIHNPIKLYGIRDYKEKAAKAKGRIKQLREEIKQLQPIRERVTEFIEERREVLRGNVEQEKQSARTLNNALAVEIDLHLHAGQEIPQPEFSAQELDRLEENATTLRDFKMLKTVHNYLEQHYGETALNRAVLQTQFSANGVAGIENFAASQTGTSLGTPFEAMSVSTTSGGGISGINTPAQQAAQSTNLGMAHQRSTTEDHLEQARQMLDNVSAKSAAANETGMGAGLAADTEAAGSEAMVALL